MHPAYSVIFFTVASGLGFGMIMAAGALAVAGALPQGPFVALVTMAVALGAATAGLLSSMLHLGHPERAWRAFSQWRTSWLSREGVLSLATYPPALVFAGLWAFGDTGIAATGAVAALLALATVVATGMIYQSLPTIRAWAQPLVAPVYVALAVATGALWLATLARAFDASNPTIDILPLVALAAAWVLKAAYWRRIDNLPPGPTAASATGLGGPETSVRMLEAPHTQENFVMREMGYRVACRHARRLRLTAQILAFALPLALSALAMALPPLAGVLLGAVAALSALAGALVERWLFFAEAKHVVTLYYGAPTA